MHDSNVEYLSDLRRTKEMTSIDDEQLIVTEAQEFYRKSYQHLAPFQTQAYIDEGMYLGNQWDNREKQYLYEQRRSANTYNKTKRTVDLISGYQKKHRQSTIVSPADDTVDQGAAIFSKALDNTMVQNNGYELLSDAFHAALVSGISFISPWMDYRDDPINGDIKFHLDYWNAVIFDPFMTKKDLSDCVAIQRCKFMSKNEIASLLPEKEDIIMSMSPAQKDDKFTWMPYNRQAGQETLLQFVEYWRAKYVNRDVLIDMESGEQLDWTGDDAFLPAILEMHPQLQKIKKPVRTVELSIIVNNRLLFRGEDPYGIGDYPFVPVFGVWSPAYDLYEWKLQSLIRSIRDSQVELNKRRSKMIDILDAQLNSGWIAKTGAVTNNESLYMAGQAQVVFLRPEASMEDLQRLNAPDIPPGQFQLEEYFANDMMENAGVNNEQFGMADQQDVQTSGILAKVRQSAGLINLQGYFDNLRYAQKLLGEKCLKLMQKNYSVAKLARITKMEVPFEIFESDFTKYMVAVEEGVLTDTQRQQQFATAVALRQIGVLGPEANGYIIQKSPLQDRSELEQILNAQAQAQMQMQQAQAEQQMQSQQVVNETLLSKAESDKALAQERLNKIQLDAALSAERIARAEEDRTNGLLNTIKSLKEIEGLDDDAILRRIALLDQLEQRQLTNAMDNAPENYYTNVQDLEQMVNQP